MAEKTKSTSNSAAAGIQTVVQSLMDGAGGVLSAKTVLGEPVQIGDTTVIPLTDVSVGCGVGASSGDKGKGGAGGGFSAKLSPNAVLILRGGSTKVVNIKNQDATAKLIDMVPELIDRFTGGRAADDMMSDDDAVEAAFPGQNAKDRT